MRLDIDTVTNLVSSSLPLSDWGFTESVKTDLTVIYNSQWCRIKFLIDRDMTKDYLYVYYGRLHALDNEQVMKWNGESCYCWHHHLDLRLALEFLDGTSPQIVYKWRRIPLPLFEDYFNSKFAKSIDSNEERYLKLHSLIWSRYGLRFFELFDLRRPDLWEQYLGFLKEYYRLKNIGFKSDIDPPQRQKC
jgi:hypothetical protein